MQITTIGLDLAKNVFQIHGVDDAGNVIVRKKLRRVGILAFFAELPPCRVGIEACATAHHWAREIAVFGHDVRLMPPSYVKGVVRLSSLELNWTSRCCREALISLVRISRVSCAQS